MLGTVPTIAGFGQDSDGHLYITSLKGGVWRVTGTGAADKPPVATFTLSSTTPAVGANVHLDASGSTDPDGPIFSYAVGHRRRRQDRRQGRDVRRQLPERRRTRDHADGRGRRRRALVAHAGGLRRRQDDAAGPAAHGTPHARRSRRRASRSSRPCASAGCWCASAATRRPPGRSRPRMRKAARLRATRLRHGARPARAQDVQGAHGQRHRAAAHPARTPEGHASGRHPRAGPRAGRRHVRAELRARARRRLTGGERRPGPGRCEV